MIRKTLIIRDQKVIIYDYELFLMLYPKWHETMSADDIEDMMLEDVTDKEKNPAG